MSEVVQDGRCQVLHLIALVLVPLHSFPNAPAGHVGSVSHFGYDTVFLLLIDVVFEGIEEIPVHELGQFALPCRVFLCVLGLASQHPGRDLSHFPVDEALLAGLTPFDVVHPNRKRVLFQLSFASLFPAAEEVEGQLVQSITDFVAIVAVLDAFAHLRHTAFRVPIRSRDVDACASSFNKLPVAAESELDFTPVSIILYIPRKVKFHCSHKCNFKLVIQ